MEGMAYGALASAPVPSVADGAIESEVHRRRSAFEIGDTLSGVFELRDIIGEGGMGQVFEARDRLLNRRVAIKVARPDVPSARIRAEAQALAAFRHPSVVAVYGLGEHAGVEYAVMELIQGTTLEAALDAYRNQRKQYPLDEALAVLAAVAEGLAVVHAAGIAHCDVKPANVMLAPRGRVVLTDFGIFRSESDRPRDRPVSGSPPYMAPERYLNEVERGGSFLVDVYAFGIMAFEVLTGEPPFRGETMMELFRRHLCETPPDIGQLRSDSPPALNKLVSTLLAKDPNDRPQSMEPVAELLKRMRV